MAYKWKPSASQRKAFAQKMQDPAEAAAYEQRKTDKANKRRSTSQFDYEKAGGSYVPTKFQHDFCFYHPEKFVTMEEKTAMTEVMYGYSCSEKVHHDSIHIVNEKRRALSV